MLRMHMLRRLYSVQSRGMHSAASYKLPAARNVGRAVGCVAFSQIVLRSTVRLHLISAIQVLRVPSDQSHGRILRAFQLKYARHSELLDVSELTGPRQN